VTWENGGSHSGSWWFHGKDGVAGSIPAGGSTPNQQLRRGTSPVCLWLEGRQLPFARDLPVRFAHCESVRAGSWDPGHRLEPLGLHDPGLLGRSVVPGSRGRGAMGAPPSDRHLRSAASLCGRRDPLNRPPTCVASTSGAACPGRPRPPRRPRPQGGQRHTDCLGGPTSNSRSRLTSEGSVDGATDRARSLVCYPRPHRARAICPRGRHKPRTSFVRAPASRRRSSARRPALAAPNQP
jgi:hypothetical protein